MGDEGARHRELVGKRQQARQGRIGALVGVVDAAVRRDDRVRRAAGRARPHLARAGRGKEGGLWSLLRARLLVVRDDSRHRLPAARLAGGQRGARRRSASGGRRCSAAGRRCCRWSTSSSASGCHGAVRDDLQDAAARGHRLARRLDRRRGTALLFTIGKFLIGLYIGKSSVASGFGAAGSLVVVLVWVYYSAQIFLLGAEFTWVYAYRYGSRQGQELPSRETEKSGRAPVKDEDTGTHDGAGDAQGATAAATRMVAEADGFIRSRCSEGRHSSFQSRAGSCRRAGGRRGRDCSIHAGAASLSPPAGRALFPLAKRGLTFSRQPHAGSADGFDRATVRSHDGRAVRCRCWDARTHRARRG